MEMDDDICSICEGGIGFFDQKIELYDKNKKKNVYCKKCYDSIPKKEKLKLSPFKKIDNNILNMGLVFGIVGGLSYKSAVNDAILKPIKQYNLTLTEINNYFIMNFNIHFFLCKMDAIKYFITKMGKQLKKDKRNEIAKELFQNEYDLLERKKQKMVKKELGIRINNNFKNNKKLKKFRQFVTDEINKQ